MDLGPPIIFHPYSHSSEASLPSPHLTHSRTTTNSSKSEPGRLSRSEKPSASGGIPWDPEWEFNMAIWEKDGKGNIRKPVHENTWRHTIMGQIMESSWNWMGFWWVQPKASQLQLLEVPPIFPVLLGGSSQLSNCFVSLPTGLSNTTYQPVTRWGEPPQYI